MSTKPALGYIVSTRPSRARPCLKKQSKQGREGKRGKNKQMWGLERTEKKDFKMVRVSQCYTLLTVFKEQT